MSIKISGTQLATDVFADLNLKIYSEKSIRDQEIQLFKPAVKKIYDIKVEEARNEARERIKNGEPLHLTTDATFDSRG